MKIIVVFLILSLAIGTLAVSTLRRGKPIHPEQCTREKFGAWKVKFNKVYSGVEEEAARFDVFCENLKRMAQHQRDSPSATFTATKYADVAEHEFKKTHRNFAFDAAAAAKSCLYSGHSDLKGHSESTAPASFDWRSQHKVSPVKDQRQCGSCWAFSTIANMESYYAIKNNVAATQQFSEQMLVDCSHGCSIDQGSKTCNQGCNGGFPWNAMADILAWGGVVTESSYPYKGSTGSCRINFNSHPSLMAPIANYTCLSSPQKLGDEGAMASWLAANGPFTIGINAGPLQMYDGGILDPSHCSPSGIDHAVTVVGYGSSNGKNYWIVKNSWGQDWGESGFFRMARGKDTCGIAWAASSVTYH